MSIFSLSWSAEYLSLFGTWIISMRFPWNKKGAINYGRNMIKYKQALICFHVFSFPSCPFKENTPSEPFCCLGHCMCGLSLQNMREQGCMIPRYLGSHTICFSFYIRTYSSTDSSPTARLSCQHNFVRLVSHFP